LLTLLCLSILAAPVVVAGEPTRPIGALLVLGGCCHNYEKQEGLLTRGLSRRANIQWTIAYDPNTTTRHKNPTYDRADWSKDCSAD
jgi:hypothetical protein